MKALVFEDDREVVRDLSFCLQVRYSEAIVISVGDAPTGKVSRAGPAGGNQGAAESSSSASLNHHHAPPVTGALGVIGLGGRAGLLSDTY